MSRTTVSSIDLFLVSLPFSAGRRTSGEETVDAYNASSHTFTQMESLIVKVTDSAGYVGWGEAFGHKSNPVTWTALKEIVAPFALGQRIEPSSFQKAAGYAFHAFGRTGPIHYAVSALDTALWDIAAQRKGLPLRLLLNENAAQEISCYASLVHYGENPVEIAHHIQRAQQEGYRSFKLHESTPAAVAAARKQAGDQALLMSDVNCHWDEAGAAEALQAFAPYNLHWLEEPVFPPDDTAALIRLNTNYGRVAAGENASGSLGMIDQITSGAVSFAQPSVGKIGGVSAMREVIAAGKDSGVAIAPHCFYFGPALNASAHIVAALNDQSQLEVPFLQWPHQLHQLHGAGPTIDLGHEPGLGFHPDQQVLTEHLLRSATLSEES